MSIHPKLEPLPDKDKYGRTIWRVVEEVRVKLAPRWYVVIPEGFCSNLGSVPRFLRPFVSPDEFPGPFVLHDYMCNEEVWEDGVPESGYTRWQSDSTLYDRLTAIKPKVPAWKCWLIWFSVRAHARLRGLK